MKEKNKALLNLRTLRKRIRQLSDQEADVLTLQASIQQAYQLARKINSSSHNPYDYYANFLLNQMKHNVLATGIYRDAAIRQKVLAFQRYQRYALSDITLFIRYSATD